MDVISAEEMGCVGEMVENILKRKCQVTAIVKVAKDVTDSNNRCIRVVPVWWN